MLICPFNAGSRRDTCVAEGIDEIAQHLSIKSSATVICRSFGVFMSDGARPDISYDNRPVASASDWQQDEFAVKDGFEDRP